MTKPVFFQKQDDFRSWLAANHDGASELLVGFYKRGAKKAGITYPEALDEALCFGWIDGVRKGLDEERYTIRFTPRKPRSIWSAVNIEKVRVLTESGRMQPPGMRAFEAREEARSRVYAYEKREAPELDAADEAAFRENQRAWAWFDSQAPSYQRSAKYWVISAKKAETRARRLATLVEHSERGERLPQYDWPARGKSKAKKSR